MVSPSDVMRDAEFKESLRQLEEEYGVQWQAIARGGVYIREGTEREVHDGSGGQLGFVPWREGNDGKIRVDGKDMQIYPDQEANLQVSIRVGKGLEIQREKNGERDVAFIGKEAKGFDELQWKPEREHQKELQLERERELDRGMER